MSHTDDEIWRRLTSLKHTNPGLQVWLSVGGWRMNNNNELTSDTFHSLVSGSAAELGQRQEAFVNSLHSVLAEYGFDGVDFDWYVSHPERHQIQHECLTDIHTGHTLQMGTLTSFTTSDSILKHLGMDMACHALCPILESTTIILALVPCNTLSTGSM